MSNLKMIGAGSLLVALLGTTAAQADVTAAEIWQDWKDYYASFGYEVTAGSEDMSGDTLTISDAVVTMTVPDNGGTMSGTIPSITMQELGDGRVEVTMAPEMKMAADIAPGTPEAVTMDMIFAQSNLKMIASGTADDTTYDFTADEVVMSIENFVAEGDAVPIEMAITLNGNAGQTVSRAGETRQVQATYSADSLDFTVKASDPEGSAGTFDMTGKLNGLNGSTDMTMPEGVDMQDMSAALKAGLSMTGNFSYGAGDYNMDFSDGAETSMTMTSAAESGKLSFVMDASKLQYGGGGTGAKVSMSGSELPFPIDISLDDSLFDMTIPLSTGEGEASDFAFETRLVNLAVSEQLWGMVDPTGQLAHDPATLIVDLTGKAKMLVDIFDPIAMETADVPAEIDSLDINEVQLTVAGAELTGNGAMTFDNSGPTPKPAGSVELKLVGGNALLDKLVAMGFVPEDQAMGARMMLGLFTVPEGDDTLTSEIEFREDGGLYANGQRLQ